MSPKPHKPPTPLPAYIYKILPPSPPPPMPLPTSLPLSPLDARDNFIHFSTSHQILGTLQRFFADVEVVYILRVPYGRVREWILWEEAGAGGGSKEDIWSFKDRRDVFAHLHGNGLKLGRDEVDDVGKWLKGPGGDWDVTGWPFAEDMPVSVSCF